jgi:CO/xanthine dehydrogenase Mo-binding subunit
MSGSPTGGNSGTPDPLPAPKLPVTDRLRSNPPASVPSGSRSIVRSAYANAVLRSVNVVAALAVPGVVAVWTAADIDDLPPIDFRDPAAEALRPYRQPLLARERLRYVGEPIAAVFATHPYLAEDGAELVSVEAHELAPILDASAASSTIDVYEDRPQRNIGSQRPRHCSR